MRPWSSSGIPTSFQSSIIHTVHFIVYTVLWTGDTVSVHNWRSSGDFMVTFSAAVCGSTSNWPCSGRSLKAQHQHVVLVSLPLSLSLSHTHANTRKHTHAHCPHDLWMTPHVTLQRNTRLIRDQIITNIEIQTYLCETLTSCVVESYLTGVLGDWIFI